MPHSSTHRTLINILSIVTTRYSSTLQIKVDNEDISYRFDSKLIKTGVGQYMKAAHRRSP